MRYFDRYARELKGVWEIRRNSLDLYDFPATKIIESNSLKDLAGDLIGFYGRAVDVDSEILYAMDICSVYLWRRGRRMSECVTSTDTSEPSTR